MDQISRKRARVNRYSARERTNLRSHPNPQRQSNPASPAPEVPQAWPHRPAHAGGVVVSNLATDDATVLHPPAVRQDAVTLSLRRALKIRVLLLEAEQNAAAEEHESLWLRGKAVLNEMQERQQRLEGFRHLLASGGGQS
jgi:hypothetical protein